jgi:acyl-CoA-binding protein
MSLQGLVGNLQEQPGYFVFDLCSTYRYHLWAHLALFSSGVNK